MKAHIHEEDSEKPPTHSRDALKHVLVALEYPLRRASRGVEEEGTGDVSQGVSEGWRVLLFFGWYQLLVVLGQLDLLEHAVVERLVGILVRETEPCSIELALLADGAAVLGHELADSEQDHGSWLFDLVERYLNFPVIIDLQNIVAHIVRVSHVIFSTAPVVWAHSGQDLTCRIEDHGLWIVLALRCLIEWVVCGRKGKTMEASCEIAVEERHLSVFYWICLTFFKLLAGKAFGVTGKLFPLSCLECCQTAIQEFGVFARERTDLRWQASGEEEVHHSLVLGLYCSGLLSLLETEADSSLDGVLLGADARELLGANPVLENLRLLLVGQVLRNLIVHPVLQVHVQLILEGVPPMILVRQLLHALLEVRRQEALGDVEAL